MCGYIEIEYGFAVIPATQENEQRKALDDKIGFYIPVYGYILSMDRDNFRRILYSLVINSLTIFFLVINMGQVARALILKKSLECACMGALGFKLPLSYITLSEDLVMIVMAGVMIGTQ